MKDSDLFTNNEIYGVKEEQPLLEMATIGIIEANSNSYRMRYMAQQPMIAQCHIFIFTCHKINSHTHCLILRYLLLTLFVGTKWS